MGDHYIRLHENGDISPLHVITEEDGGAEILLGLTEIPLTKDEREQLAEALS